MAHARSVLLALTLVACGGKLVESPDDGTVVSGQATSHPSHPIQSSSPGSQPTPSPWQSQPCNSYQCDQGPIYEPGPPSPPVDAGIEPQPVVLGPADTDWSWTAFDFTYDRTSGTCTGGAKYIRYSTHYAKWVGVELCSATRYKIYLGEAKEQTFHEIADYAGGGEDHCELVSATFTNPNEDDITSGCPSCALGDFTWKSPGPVPVYSRGYFGEAFDLGPWPDMNYYSPYWYECGVSIP